MCNIYVYCKFYLKGCRGTLLSPQLHFTKNNSGKNLPLRLIHHYVEINRRKRLVIKSQRKLDTACLAGCCCSCCCWATLNGRGSWWKLVYGNDSDPCRALKEFLFNDADAVGWLYFASTWGWRCDPRGREVWRSMSNRWTVHRATFHENAFACCDGRTHGRIEQVRGDPRATS